MLSVMVFTAMLGNIFQQLMFLCSQAQIPADWWPSHINLLLL
jgi:hypothetical protein